MDEFAVYSRALTAGEVTALYQSRGDASQALAGQRSLTRTPSAYIDADVIVGVPPLAVNFSAKRSLDPDSLASPKLTYAWDFADGSTATGLEVSHSFKDYGEYPVTLTVTNAAGVSHQATFPIKVANRAQALRLR